MNPNHDPTQECDRKFDALQESMSKTNRPSIPQKPTLQECVRMQARGLVAYDREAEVIITLEEWYSLTMDQDRFQFVHFAYPLLRALSDIAGQQVKIAESSAALHRLIEGKTNQEALQNIRIDYNNLEEQVQSLYQKYRTASGSQECLYCGNSNGMEYTRAHIGPEDSEECVSVCTRCHTYQTETSILESREYPEEPCPHCSYVNADSFVRFVPDWEGHGVPYFAVICRKCKTQHRAPVLKYQDKGIQENSACLNCETASSLKFTGARIPPDNIRVYRCNTCHEFQTGERLLRPIPLPRYEGCPSCGINAEDSWKNYEPNRAGDGLPYSVFECPGCGHRETHRHYG